MESDPAIVLLGGVVVLLVAILLGVVLAARDRSEPGTDGWTDELDELHGRLATITQELATLRVEIGHLEDLADLGEDDQRLREEDAKLVGALAQIARFLVRGHAREP